MALRTVIAFALLLHGLGAWAQGNPLPGEKGTITARSCGDTWNNYFTVKWDSGAVVKYFCFDVVRTGYRIGDRVINNDRMAGLPPSLAPANPPPATATPAPAPPAPAAPVAKVGTIEAVKLTIKLSDGSTLELPLQDQFPIRIGNKVEVIAGGRLKVLP